MIKALQLLAAIILLPILINAQPKDANFKKVGAPIPLFVIEKTNGTLFDASVIKPNKPVMIMIASPGCDHCDKMIDSIKAISPMLKNMQIVLVTEMRNKPNLKGFLKDRGLTNNPQFANAGYDKSNLIYFIYNSQLLPQINIYNSKQKLVKTFGGNFPMDSLKMYMK